MKRKINSLKLLLTALFFLAVSTSKAQDIIALSGFTAGTLGAFCAEETINLTAASTGATAYTWQRYAGTTATGTPTAITGTGNGSVISDTPPAPGYYTYVSSSTNAEGCAIASDPATIYYLPGITATVASSIPGTDTYCENNFPSTVPVFTATPAKVTTNGTVTETFGYTYQWYKGTDAISGATSETYTLSGTDDITTGVHNYSVRVNYQVKSCTAAISNNITITVTATPGKPVITLTL